MTIVNVRTIATYGWIRRQVDGPDLRVSGHLALSLHSSNEPGELSWHRGRSLPSPNASWFVLQKIAFTSRNWMKHLRRYWFWPTRCITLSTKKEVSLLNLLLAVREGPSHNHRSLDFVINRLFLQLFRTNNMDTVKQCQQFLKILNCPDWQLLTKLLKFKFLIYER